MEYPFFEVPLLGGGLLIGVVAIFHVFVSHFAVGGGLYLVLTERKAYKEKNNAVLEYVKRHTLFFVLITLVFGAISGVGIWFSIGLVHPMATSALIHAFVWGWAIEWIFFFVEIAAAFIYYYSWSRVSRKVHLTIGWIYFVSAWLSLAVINGILSFMLTPGAWLETQNFWHGILNPTYIVSALIRTAVAISLAGLYGLLTSTWIRDDEENRAVLVKYNSKWLLTGMIFIVILGPLFISSIPPLARFISMGGAAAVTLFAVATVFLSALIAVFAYFGPFRQPRSFTTTFAVLFLVLGFAVTGITEWTREAVRKPYIIYGYMYSNSFLTEEFISDENKARIDTEGSLSLVKWRRLTDVDNLSSTANKETFINAGRELFRVQCEACHTIDGYNGVLPLIYGWDREKIEQEIKDLHDLKKFMPPFIGTVEERQALADWLNSIKDLQEEEVN